MLVWVFRCLLNSQFIVLFWLWMVNGRCSGAKHFNVWAVVSIVFNYHLVHGGDCWILLLSQQRTMGSLVAHVSSFAGLFCTLWTKYYISKHSILKFGSLLIVLDIQCSSDIIKSFCSSLDPSDSSGSWTATFDYRNVKYKTLIMLVWKCIHLERLGIYSQAA